MEERKNPKHDLTKKTGLYFNVGLIVALGLVISAFEWKSYADDTLVDLGDATEAFDELLDMPITQQPPPPPPKPVKPVFNEVPDEEDIEDELKPLIDAEPDITVPDIPIVIAEPEPEEPTDVPFTVVEKMPEPEGGLMAFLGSVSKKLKYPRQARRMGVEGKVFVEFIINEKGELTEVKAIKGIGAGCDEEAIRVISNSKRWKPGKQRGKPVKVKMVLPITFQLD